jgi:hypothetical protein
MTVVAHPFLLNMIIYECKYKNVMKYFEYNARRKIKCT